MRYLVTPLLLSILISCGSQDSAPEKHTDESAGDTLISESDTLVTLTGVSDGIDADFYVYSEEEEFVIPDQASELHIVPSVAEDSTQTDPYMMVALSNNFSYYSDVVKTFTGKVKVYYDGFKKHLAAEFDQINGITTGTARFYDPKGKLLVERVYEDGNCVESIADLYSIDWTFNPDLAQLTINNLDEHSQKNQDGGLVVKLGESMIPDQGYNENGLYWIIQKSVFDEVFTLNGEPFTGELLGYYAPSSASKMDPYFDLEFKDGFLHGHIKIYNDWGELDLEEIFENGELVETVYKADYSEADGVAKPIIYLYPEEDRAVQVALNFNGQLTHCYPAYPAGGWKVWATSNGTLYDTDKKEYYALFWEGQNNQEFTFSEGFVIAGNETAEFLESSLDILGLNRREANEFILYWLPQMEDNPYNLIHFSSAEYEEMAQLKITPAPETIIRVMMVWSPLTEPIDIPLQNLRALHKERQGFTAVEWGGKRQKYEPESN